MKDGLSQSRVSEMVCERWCDKVVHVCKMVWTKKVCERWCVTKWCVKDFV